MKAIYVYPLSRQDRQEMFNAWVSRNEQLLSQMVRKAKELQRRIGYVSVKYLLEWARYEVPYSSIGVPFIDNAGKKRCYRINNTDSPMLARYLKAKYPNMNIMMKRLKP